MLSLLVSDTCSNDAEVVASLRLSIPLNLSPSIDRLDLQWRGIGDSGVEKIMKALKYNSSVTFVNLHDNNIHPFGAKCIAEMLSVNKGLKELILSWNNFGDAGIIDIAKALWDNKCLEELWLWNNEISDESAQALLEALEHNNTLKVLYMDSFSLSLDLQKKIKDRLELNATKGHQIVQKERASEVETKTDAEPIKAEITTKPNEETQTHVSSSVSTTSPPISTPPSAPTRSSYTYSSSLSLSSTNFSSKFSPNFPSQTTTAATPSASVHSMNVTDSDLSALFTSSTKTLSPLVETEESHKILASLFSNQMPTLPTSFPVDGGQLNQLVEQHERKKRKVLADNSECIIS